MEVVVLAPHPDDELLGCGGTMQRLAASGHNVTVVFFSGRDITHYDEDTGEWTAVDNVVAGKEVGEMLGVDRVHALDYTMAQFNSVPHFEMNKDLEELELDPDLILTSSNKDANWDHEVTFRVALVLGRPKKTRTTVLSYEILSSTEWGDRPFDPAFYVDIGDQLETKVEAMKRYEHEIREFPHPRSPESIEVTAKRRGIEAGYEAAEAFEVVRGFPETMPQFHDNE